MTMVHYKLFYIHTVSQKPHTLISSWISVSSSNTTWQTFASLFVFDSLSDDRNVAATFFCSARGTSFENAATSIANNQAARLQYPTAHKTDNCQLFPVVSSHFAVSHFPGLGFGLGLGIAFHFSNIIDILGLGSGLGLHCRLAKWETAKWETAKWHVRWCHPSTGRVFYCARFNPGMYLVLAR